MLEVERLQTPRTSERAWFVLVWAAAKRAGSYPRVVLWLLSLLAMLAAALFANYVAAMRLVGSFLVVDAPLQPAAAIVVLAGQMPAREVEATLIYRAGWAPRLVLVPGADADIGGGSAVPDWQARRDLLVRLGVPAEAITVASGRATDTLQELELAQRAIGPDAQRVILVSSRFHTRRVLSGWQHIAPSVQAIVRVARQDSYDPDRWWYDPSMRAVVVHEYLGLLELGLRWVWRPPLDLPDA